MFCISNYILYNSISVILSWLIDKSFRLQVYRFSEREKIKLASFPLDDDHHILRVSIEKEEPNHNKIIDNIIKIIGNDIKHKTEK